MNEVVSMKCKGIECGVVTEGVRPVAVIMREKRDGMKMGRIVG